MHGDFSSTASIARLKQRAALLADVRRFFDGRGFWEVETPLLSADTVVDRHIDPIPVDDPSLPTEMWLQTSPEFGMKRLLASGADAIYQIAKCFRAGEAGAHHNPEFTMVEWYRAGHGYDDGMRLLSDLAEAFFQRGPAERIRYADAVERTLHIDPHRASSEQLAACAAEHQVDVDASFSDDRDEWLNLLLAERIQPQLGRDRPVILFDYPATQSALARVAETDPPTAERFELFVDGVELANGYHELLDAALLRNRADEANRQRAADSKPPLPVQSRLLRAMEAGLPSCSGCALGFDRLVMLLTGAKSLAEVIPFPIDRA